MSLNSSLTPFLKRLALFGLMTLVPVLYAVGLAAAATPQVPSKPSGQAVHPRSAAKPVNPCCEITGIDASGKVTAQDKTTGKSFQFQVSDANLLTSLHVGQGVTADFATNRVTVYGANPCCEIIGAGAASTGGLNSAAGTAGSNSAPVSADDLPGIRMQIRELKHTGNSVTLRFTIFNDGSTPFAIAYNFGGWGNVQNVRLVDAVTNKSYSVTSANGCQCSENVRDIAPKSQADLWAKFAVPPEVQKITVTIPHFAPLEDVSIAAVGNLRSSGFDSSPL